MCKFLSDNNSILEYLNELNITTINDVYDHYRDIIDSDERWKFSEDLCERIRDGFSERSLKTRKKNVFLSYSHKNLIYAYSLAMLLHKKYKVNVYIDAFDFYMPLETNVESAKRLEERINQSDRFIFIGTEDSFKSYWCQWELGLGNHLKSKGRIAFFVLTDRKEKQGDFTDNEYVGLYPFIWDKTNRHNNANDDDLFVGYHEKNDDTLVSLKDWLHKNKNFFK